MARVETPNALFGKHVVCILCSLICCEISGTEFSSVLWHHVIWYGNNQRFGEHSTSSLVQMHICSKCGGTVMLSLYFLVISVCGK